MGAQDGDGTTRAVPLPQLGESVNEGTIVAWLISEGDVIEVEQPIAEISTDKVDTEIPSPMAGRVVRLLVAVDDEVEVGQAILELAGDDATGGDDDPAPSDTADDSTNGDTSTSPRCAVTGTTIPPDPQRRLSPLVRRLLAEHALDPDTVTGTGSGGRITPDDVRTAAAEGAAAARPGRQRLSPLVKRLLREHGFDAADLVGTGTEGRITPEDVRAAAQTRDAAPTAGPTSTAEAPTASAEPPPADATTSDGARQVTEPLSRMRKVIADRMHTSLQTTAQLTAAVEADVTRLMHVRGELKDAAVARHGFAPSPLAFIACATMWALARHPVINASIDTDAGTVTYYRTVGLGLAVDTDAGLMVPVLHDAQDLTLMALQARLNDLAARARDRKLSPDDVSGGTFTITNTGSGGTLFDTPILNPPEAAILATPKIEKRPVVVEDAAGNDQVAIRHRTYLCLSYDHRLIDGADAARFLTDLADTLDTTDWRQELGELT